MKKAILVLGPPRSGTSVISHVIHKLGADFGSHDRFVDPVVHAYNPIFFELQSLNSLNDEMFSRFAKAFYDFDWVPEESDFSEAVVREFEQKIAAFIEEEFSGSSTIGLKDPRFCYTLPIWDAVLRRLGFDVRYVLTRRLSSAVIASNKGLNRLSPAANFRLVVQSTLLAHHFVVGRNHVVIRYEDLLAVPSATILRLCESLDLDRALIGDASAVIREDLNHQKRTVGSFLYSYFEHVIDSESVSPDEYCRYREIVLAATMEKDQENAGLSQVLWACNEHIVELRQTVANLKASLKAFEDSTSWQLTRPVRFVGEKIRQATRILRCLGF